MPRDPHGCEDVHGHSGGNDVSLDIRSLTVPQDPHGCEDVNGICTWWSSQLKCDNNIDHLATFGFRVLFRERGILSIFHAGKMTTHRAKIPRFRCSYFQPCVPVLGHRLVFNIVRETGSCEHSTFSLRLFPACVCFCLDRIGHYF